MSPSRCYSKATASPFFVLEDWMLAAGWLVGALHPTEPYPHAERCR